MCLWVLKYHEDEKCLPAVSLICGSISLSSEIELDETCLCLCGSMACNSAVEGIFL
jgi:hypothetical protein